MGISSFGIYFGIQSDVGNINTRQTRIAKLDELWDKHPLNQLDGPMADNH